MRGRTRTLLTRWWSDALRGRVARVQGGYVVRSDALTLLRELPARCADIVFLDPPFNLGKAYGGSNGTADKMDDEEYYQYVASVIARSVTTLREGGALYLYQIPRWALRLGAYMQTQLVFRHWIAISMKNGFVRGRRLYPAHYALLYFTKGEPRAFARPKVPLQKCRHCDRPIRDYGGYKRFMARGVNLSDFWDDISPVRHRRYKNRDANELPIEIPKRIMQISGVPDGIFVDPFAGGGTTLVVARENGMRFIGGDLEARYCELIADRLRSSRSEG